MGAAKMQTDRLSVTLAALADPTRRAILARLKKGDASVQELAAPYDMSLAAVSKHLKVLEKAKLISRSREAQYRPCHFEAAPLGDVSEWLEQYRQFWDRSLDALEVVLEEMKRTATSKQKATRSPRTQRKGKK